MRRANEKTLGSEQCRLCGGEKPLCRSHIIPEFLYTPLYDSRHRFFRLSTGEKPERAFEQKGVREKLLCENCEGQFSAYESYARGVLFGGIPIELLMNSSQGFECRVEYDKFKLFQLSLLWRVGITCLPEFQDVDLGIHEERLHQLLINHDPARTEDYGCILIWPQQHGDVVAQLIMSMGMVQVTGVPCCRLILGGMHWFFFLTDKALDSRQAGLFLQESGELRILKSDLGTSDYVGRLATDLYDNNPQLFEGECRE